MFENRKLARYALIATLVFSFLFVPLTSRDNVGSYLSWSVTSAINEDSAFPSLPQHIDFGSIQQTFNQFLRWVIESVPHDMQRWIGSFTSNLNWQPFIQPVNASVITRVQGNARGNWSSGTSFTVVMGSTPTNGNTTILVIGTYGGGTVYTVSSVSQTGVTWSGSGNGLQVAKTQGSNMRLEIWLGTVGSGAGTTITINLSGTPSYSAIGDACEYSGLLGASIVLDKTATNGGTGTTGTTGTTATTTANNELWVGGIIPGNTSGGTMAQSSPTNSFTLLDGANQVGAASHYSSLSFLEKTVSSTGTASSGTTFASANAGWAGAIATFKGPASTPVTVTQNLTNSPTASAVLSANRTVALTETNANAVSRIASHFITMNESAITNILVLAGSFFSVGVSESETTSPTLAAIRQAVSSASLTLTITPTAATLLSAFRSLPQTETITPTASRAALFHAVVNQTQTFSALLTKGSVHYAALFMSVTNTPTLTQFVTYAINIQLANTPPYQNGTSFSNQNSSPITRVQGNARGYQTHGDHFTITMSSTPTQGNVIVLTLGYYLSVTVSSVSQTGVTWSGGGNGVQATSSNGNMHTEIWLGTVGSGAGKVITVTFSGAIAGAVGDACEYSGLAPAIIVLDKTAINSGFTTSTDTGTTATISQASELLVGTVAILNATYNATQSNPTNGFTLLDGTSFSDAVPTYNSLSYLEKIVSSAGSANSGTTQTVGQGWAGAIATFKGAPVWSNPINAQTVNSQYATVFDATASSAYLEALNFGALNIPASAPVVGIQVQVTRHASASSGTSDYSLRLVKAGTITGNDKASPAAWSTGDTTITYGSTNDTWGLGTLTGADVNASNFGVALSVITTGTASVDWIGVTITYLQPTVGGSLSALTIFSRSAAKSLTISNTLARLGFHYETSPQSLTISNLVSKVWVAHVNTTVVAHITQTLGRVQTATRNLIGTVTTALSISVLRALTPAVAVTITNSVSRVLVASRSITESVTLGVLQLVFVPIAQIVFPPTYPPGGVNPPIIQQNAFFGLFGEPQIPLSTLTSMLIIIVMIAASGLYGYVSAGGRRREPEEKRKSRPQEGEEPEYF